MLVDPAELYATDDDADDDADAEDAARFSSADVCDSTK